jgi:hypothetical protein
MEYIDELALFTEADLRKVIDLEFRKAHLMDFHPTAEDLALKELACVYHDRCDAYDRAVCSGIRHNEPFPVDAYELGLINKHARRVRDDLIRQGTSMGLTGGQVDKAIRDYRG